MEDKKRNKVRFCKYKNCKGSEQKSKQKYIKVYVKKIKNKQLILIAEQYTNKWRSQVQYSKKQRSCDLQER